MSGNLIRQHKLQDGVNDTLLAQVNASKELHVADSSLITLGAASITLQTNSLSVQNASLTQLADIETAIAAIETAIDLTTVAVNSVETAVDLTTVAVNSVETNQTDKSQMVNITDGTLEAEVVANEDDMTDLDDKNGLVTSSVLYTRISDTDIRPLRADAATHSIQTMSYEHHEIHSGSHYFVDGYADLAINNVMDFTWLMPNTTKWTHWTWKLAVEAETLYQVYETAVATNPLANVITPLNNNRNSGNTSGTTMRYEVQTNLAGANADTDVSGATLIASGIIGAGRSGGFDSRDKEIILKQGTLYCLRSTASAAGYQNFLMEWYEHINKN